eukprot:gene7077-18975_t
MGCCGGKGGGAEGGGAARPAKREAAPVADAGRAEPDERGMSVQPLGR